MGGIKCSGGWDFLNILSCGESWESPQGRVRTQRRGVLDEGTEVRKLWEEGGEYGS